MVQTSNFKPTDEFMFYQALVEADILPNEKQTEMWNNPDSVVHKAWLYFKSSLAENNKTIECIQDKIDEEDSPCYECALDSGRL